MIPILSSHKASETYKNRQKVGNLGITGHSFAHPASYTRSHLWAQIQSALGVGSLGTKIKFCCLVLRIGSGCHFNPYERAPFNLGD